MTYSEFINQAFRWETDYASAPFGTNNRLYHAMLGLASEGLELATAQTDTNKLAELFDHCWFAALGIVALGKQFAEPNFNPYPPQDLAAITKLDEVIASELKRRLFYGKAKLSDDELFDIFITIWLRARSIGDTHSLHDFLVTGLKKLEVRFGAGYSGDKAVNRDALKEADSEKRFVDPAMPTLDGATKTVLVKNTIKP